MSSKEKRRSSLLNPFGFGSSATHKLQSGSRSSNNTSSKHRTIILPKDNDVISESDLPKRKGTLDSTRNIPSLPPQRLSVEKNTPKPSNPTLTVAKQSTPTQSKSIVQPPPQIAISPSSTNSSLPMSTSSLDPAKSLQSELSLQRSNSPGAIKPRRTLVRKPPPEIVPKKPVPVEQHTIPEDKSEEKKPELNRLITSLEDDVSDFNPTSGISPVPSSVYSPYSPLNVNTNSANKIKTSSNLRLVESEKEQSPDTSGDISPADLDEEFRKIEELLNKSTILNQTVDHHLTHSRNASLDPNALNDLDKTPTVMQASTFEDDENDADDEIPNNSAFLPKEPAISNLNSIVRGDRPSNPPEKSILQDISMIGSPSFATQRKLGSDTPLDTTDDEFYDAENGDLRSSVQDLQAQQIQQNDDDDNNDNNNNNNNNSDEIYSDEDDEPVGSKFKVVNGSPTPSSSPSDGNNNLSNIAQHDTTIDLSSAEQTPEPFNIQSPLRNKISMDVINGHGSDYSRGNNISNDNDYNYEGNDYVNEYNENGNHELQNRYISQQEDFFQNQTTLSPVTYVNGSPTFSSHSNFANTLNSDGSSLKNPPSIQISGDSRSIDRNVSPNLQNSSSSEDLGEDEEKDDDLVSDDEEDKLSFTARSPFYSPFEYSEDSLPRRMIITNNVSDPESDDNGDDQLKGIANRKRNSYFGDLDIDSYVAEENARLLLLQESLQVPRSMDGSRSPVITPSEGQKLSHVYDRREEVTVVPVAYSNPTSSAAHPATSPGSSNYQLLEQIPAVSTSANSTKKKPIRRRPPPDFPVTGRSGRSLSVNQQQQPVFVENGPITEDLNTPPVMKQAEITTTTTSNGSSGVANNAAANEGAVSLVKPRINPGEGEKSAYVMALRRKASTSYSDIGPPKWTLPVAIRSESEKSKVTLSTKYSRTTMSLFKKGVLSSADIKHGNLKPRLLASEVDEEEVAKANEAAAALTRTNTNTTTSSLAHTQLGSMVPPSHRMSSELHLVPSKSNSLYSNNSSGNNDHKRHASLQYDDQEYYDDFAIEEFRGGAPQINSPKLDDINELNRSGSVKSYLPGANNNGKLKLFIVNPDNEDSD